MFPLLLLTVEVQSTICNVFYKLAKFEQQFRTTNNLELYNKKPFTMLTISYILLAPLWKKFLQVKQLNY